MGARCLARDHAHLVMRTVEGTGGRLYGALDIQLLYFLAENAGVHVMQDVLVTATEASELETLALEVGQMETPLVFELRDGALIILTVALHVDFRTIIYEITP